jgi:hypothetical protein
MNEYLLLTPLDLGVTTDEVVKTLHIRLRTVRGKGKVVVLEVETNAGEVNDRLDASSPQLLGVADARSLEDEGRRQRAAGHNDLLPRPECSPLTNPAARLGGDGLDAYRTAVLDDDLVHLGVGGEIQVRVDGPGGVDVGVGAVAPAARVAVDPLEPVLGTVGRYEVLQVVDDGDPLGLDGPEEVVLDGVCIVTERDLDGALVAVEVGVV